jgi:hypothetical protein
MTDEWRVTENLPAVALSTGWYWHRAVANQTTRILASTDQINQQADALLLILALRQVVRAATLARDEARGPKAEAVLDRALARFDRQLPGASRARDVLEHFEDYLRGTGDHQQPAVNRRARQVDEGLAVQWRTRFRSSPGMYIYIVGELEIDVSVARSASSMLIDAIHESGNMSN